MTASIHPRTSITRRALTSSAIMLTAVVCIAAGATFLHLRATITHEAEVQLRDYVGERLAREQLTFTLALADLTIFASELKVALAQPPVEDLDARFAQIAQRQPDGTWRSPAGLDYKRVSQIFAGPQTVADAATKHLYVTAYRMVTDYGRAWHHSFQDTYITTPENGIVLYWPDIPDWYATMKADFDMTKEPYLMIADRAHNPARTSAWTPVYYDPGSKAWLISVANPIDIDGRHVANAGHDIALNELIDRTVNMSIPGAHNAIFRGDGRVIAHPALMAKLAASGGELRVEDAKSPELSGLLAIAKASGGKTVVAANGDGESLVALGHLAGPDWYLAIVYPKALISSRAMSAAQFALLLSLGALGVQLLALFLVMRRQIARPLIELTTATEGVRRGEFSTKVEVKRDDEIGALGTSFNAMTQAIGERDHALAEHAAQLEGIVELRTAALAARNAEMRLVLDQVRQGLVIIDTAGALPTERAAILDTWFGSPREGDSFVGWIERSNPDYAAQLAFGLDEIRDDYMPLEVTLDQLPRRARIGDRTLAFDYQHVSGAAGATRVLIVVTDATDAIRHAHADVEQRDLLRLFQRMRVDRSGVRGFLREGTMLVATSASAPEKASSLRAIHTLKGNAGIFEQELIAKTCHQIEDGVDEAGELTAEACVELHAMWERFLERTAGLAVDDDGVGLDVTDADLELLTESVRRGDPGDRLLERIEQLRHERVTAALARCADQARGLAERLGKPGVTVMVDAADLRLPAERFAGLFGALVHAVRNAIDHGIELPAARAAAGKAPGGRMELTTRLVGDELIVRIFDDGAGIDWAAIAAKAADRGLPHATHHDLVAALFHDGLSTREEVTILSGRGVGMSALLAETQRLGGAITVTSERGRGTVMEVRCPLAVMTTLRAVS